MKWIKCPQCGSRGYTELVGRHYQFYCVSCGYRTPLRLLNKKKNDTIQTPKRISGSVS